MVRCAVLEHFLPHKKLLKKFLKKAKFEKKQHHLIEIIKNNILFFENSNRIYLKSREIIYNMILNSTDIYGVDNLKNSFI